MKKIFLIILIGILGVGLVQAQTRSPKRGLCFNGLGAGDIQVLSSGVSWVYNWGANSGNLNVMADNNMEFAPMAWGKNKLDTTALRALVTANPNIKYLLGFNEPTQTGQANLTPAAAAAAWIPLAKSAHDLNLKLVSPAMSYGNLSGYTDAGTVWLDEFFNLIGGTDDIAAIAVHCYYTSSGQVSGYINNFKKYGKPIWLTEFCADQTPTIATQKQFLVQTIDYLESDPAVERYAWFKERGSTTGNLSNNSILKLGPNTDGQLTELGLIFVNMSSHDNNFYFTTETQIPATQYLNSNVVNMEQTSDNTGLINLAGLGTSSWMEYNVDIPTAGEYYVYFRVANEFPTTTATIQVSVNNTTIGSLPVVHMGQNIWNTQVCKATFGQGKQQVKISFTRGGLKINWFEITPNELSAVPTVQASDINVYPNPVKDFLNIQTSDNNASIALYDILGKNLYSGKVINGGIDMSYLSSGMYILNVQNNNGENKTIKIMKEK